MIRRVSTTTTSDAYTTGMVVNGALTIERFGNGPRISAILRQIIVKQTTTGVPDMDFIFLDSALSSDLTTLTNAAVVQINDTELTKIVGVASATASMLFEDNGIMFVTGLDVPMQLANPAADSNLYVIPVIRATSPVDWGDLEFTFVFEGG